jgi:valyl-tRNA synthetase
MENLPKAYQSKEVENKIYEIWEKSGFFNPDNLPGRNKEPFCIIMPPTNANGSLHLGHGLVMSIEDAIIRYQRMQGKKTLWLPGADHAGFETQVVYEKKLEKEGRSRFQMEREDFYKEVWEFTQTNKEHMTEQVKRLGGSCDWSRETFTLDPKIIDVVYDTFNQMYQDGLIYRSNRIINYCPKHRTALSDLETQYIEQDSFLYYVKYQDSESDEFLIIATTRPETIPGDLAVAVNPKDKRYKSWVNKKVIEPITKRLIPVIQDESVDISFGTGALKVTPSHDATDFEIGQKHNLGFLSIINLDGKLNENSGPLVGLKPKVAREEAIKILIENKTFIKQEPYKHNVSVCYKCNTPIEPLVIPQWFISMTKPINNSKKSLRDLAVEAVRNGDVKFSPKRFEKIFFHWMKELKDWNISRQIYWGIPIPAWYKEEEIKIQKECPGDGWEKDSDVFDTWFSSSQWPFATLMVNQENDFKTYFPTSVMETAYDIIFFWVARMIIMSLYKTDKIPFKKVLFHGLVRDKNHQKMSKSKGNSINPIEICDQYGADVLRWSMLYGTKIGDDLSFSNDKIIGARNFVNKVWNASKFVLMNLADFDFSEVKLEGKYEKYIESNKNIVTRYKKNFDKLNLTGSSTLLYKYFWFTFADKIIEDLKQDIKNDVNKKQAQYTLLYILENNLRMLHPFIPFITEYIWSLIPHRKNLLIVEEL